MKKKIFVILLAFLAISCTKEQPSNPDVAIIKGKVLSGDMKEVEIKNITQNPITNSMKTYTAEIGKDSTFSIEIPLERLGTGEIWCDNFYHDIYLLPGDNFHVEIDGDTIRYNGNGASKNEFLYIVEKEHLTDGDFYDEFNSANLSPEDFLTSTLDIKKKRLNFLNSFSDSVELSKKFVEFFEVATREISDYLIHEYPNIYSYYNSLSISSLNLSEEFTKLQSFSNYVDDSKVISHNYSQNVLNMVYSKARDLRNIDTTLEWEESFYTVMFDSLPPTTELYTFTKYILNQLSNNVYDTVAIEKFDKMETAGLAKISYDEALSKFNAKQDLIGKPMHEEFSKTAIQDTSGLDLTFGDIMKDMAGKVVYLDCWSMGCGPCLAAMPESKKLKEKLKDLPIEFVYFTQDSPRGNYWEKVFETTHTKKNHYTLVNGFNSRMNEFMQIKWVPNYMIFDKEGKLIDFTADRPYNVQANIESELEKTLRELAGE